jgi:hypothetical protein
MKKRTWKIPFVLFGALFVALAACSTTRVYSPTDTPGQQTGSVTSLSHVLTNPGAPITLVFIHGVGDHCRGYALGDPANPSADKAAWLNPGAMKALHLEPIHHTWQDHEVTASELDVGGPLDGSDNLILLRERKYAWKMPGEAAARTVRAFEVTWSPLTRWIKNSLLGYDATNVALIPWIPGSNGVPTCRDPTDQIGQQSPHDPWFSPPHRVPLNAILKWTVLDRDLADAVIYAGTYGIAMQRGMAVALCRIAGRTENYGKPCVWPKTTSAVRPGRFIFVTHSLGSRLLYDTLLSLMNPAHAHTQFAGMVPSNDLDVWTKDAAATTRDIVQRTAGFYMMANQLPMLGLAHIPICAPINYPQPFVFNPQGAGRVPNGRQTFAVQTDSLVGILRERRRSLQKQETKPSLDIVSFNDTNDLLTWHIPAWYATAGGGAPYGIQVADVFVKNSLHLLGLAEWPPSAHSGYFNNKAVWRVIYCGAKNGHVNSCPE